MHSIDAVTAELGGTPPTTVQGDLIGHVHVKDLIFKDPNARFVTSETARVHADERAVTSRVVGEGSLEWSRILRRLREVGYNDVLSLEYEYRWHPQDLADPETGFRRGAVHLRTLLSELELIATDQGRGHLVSALRASSRIFWRMRSQRPTVSRSSRTPPHRGKITRRAVVSYDP